MALLVWIFYKRDRKDKGDEVTGSNVAMLWKISFVKVFNSFNSFNLICLWICKTLFSFTNLAVEWTCCSCRVDCELCELGPERQQLVGPLHTSAGGDVPGTGHEAIV